MKNKIFSGVGTALITPFNNGKIDLTAFENLLQRQINANVDAVIVLGTTGEPATVNKDEREDLIKLAISKCKNKCKVIVGCGSNNTQVAIENYKLAETLGADGALIVTPYYNKCTQNGLVEHYKAISDSGNLPIIVYNVPSRTGFNIIPETYLSLKEIKNIVGIKEASGNISQVIEVFRLVGCDLAVYSGEDFLNYIFEALGGSGTISVLSNVVPNLTKQVLTLLRSGNFEEAKKLSAELMPLANALFLEVNPTPVKAALNYLGLCRNELRLPLVEMTDVNFKKLKTEIDKLWAKYDCL